MPPRLSGLLGVALLLVPATAAQAAAPRPLHDKTILLSWSQHNVETWPDGVTRPRQVLNQRTVYVSSAGRLFTRATRTGRRTAHIGDYAPGEDRTPDGHARQMQFQGNQLVGSLAFASGAGRAVATFDPGFSSCSLNVVFGRQGGAPIRWRTRGRMVEVQAISVSAPSCVIRDGNVFGDR
jgi:hypothetical protein